VAWASDTEKRKDFARFSAQNRRCRSPRPTALGCTPPRKKTYLNATYTLTRTIAGCRPWVASRLRFGVGDEYRPDDM
jgi:hypothetical protein